MFPPRGMFMEAGRYAAVTALALSYMAGGRAESGLRIQRVQIVNLHRLPKRYEPQFRRLLCRLADTHRFIPYSEAVARIRQGHIQGSYLSFTMDDGFRSCLRAAQVLEEYGAKACFFVCPSVVGETDPAIMAKFCEERLKEHPAEFMSWADLEQLRNRGHEIGSHTMTHARLSESSGLELLQELGESRFVLKQRLGGEVRHFAWPFGDRSSFSEEAAAAARAAGYESIASGIRGCHWKAHPASEWLLRDHIDAGWPISHSLYFLARNGMIARQAGAAPVAVARAAAAG